jgi:hypothetical protein
MHDHLLRAFHAVMDVAGVVLLASDGSIVAHDVGALAQSIADRAIITAGESALVMSELGRVLVVRVPTPTHF